VDHGRPGRYPVRFGLGEILRHAFPATRFSALCAGGERLEIADWRLEIVDWEFKVAGAKRTQFAGGQKAPRRHREHGDGCKWKSQRELDNMLCDLCGSVVKDGKSETNSKCEGSKQTRVRQTNPISAVSGPETRQAMKNKANLSAEGGPLGIADFRRSSPGMSNEPNFARRTVGGHGPPCRASGETPNVQNVKRSQFNLAVVRPDRSAEARLPRRFAPGNDTSRQSPRRAKRTQFAQGRADPGNPKNET